MERYFLVTYYVTWGSREVTGNFSVRSKSDFPSNKYLQDEAAKKLIFCPANRVVITNLFEFKNKKDFESFNKTNG